MKWPCLGVVAPRRFVAERVFFTLENGRSPKSCEELAEWSGVPRVLLRLWHEAAREVFGEGVAGA